MKSHKSCLFRAAMVVMVISLLSACGYRGPLYLPDEPASESSPEQTEVNGPPPEAGDAQEDESDTEETGDPSQ